MVDENLIGQTQKIKRRGEGGEKSDVLVTTPILEANTCSVRAIKLEKSKTHNSVYPNSDPPAISVAPTLDISGRRRRRESKRRSPNRQKEREGEEENRGEDIKKGSAGKGILKQRTISGVQVPHAHKKSRSGKGK